MTNNTDKEELQFNFNYALQRFQSNFEKAVTALSESFNKLTDTLLKIHAGALVVTLAFIGSTYGIWSEDAAGIPFLTATYFFVGGLFFSLIGYSYNYVYNYRIVKRYESAFILPEIIFANELLNNTIWNRVIKQETHWLKKIFKYIPFIILGFNVCMLALGFWFGYVQLDILSEDKAKPQQLMELTHEQKEILCPKKSLYTPIKNNLENIDNKMELGSIPSPGRSCWGFFGGIILLMN